LPTVPQTTTTHLGSRPHHPHHSSPRLFLFLFARFCNSRFLFLNNANKCFMLWDSQLSFTQGARMMSLHFIVQCSLHFRLFLMELRGECGCEIFLICFLNPPPPHLPQGRCPAPFPRTSCSLRATCCWAPRLSRVFRLASRDSIPSGSIGQKVSD